MEGTLEGTIAISSRGKPVLCKRIKMNFGKKEVEYLGHIISKEGVNVDPKKIQVINEWP